MKLFEAIIDANHRAVAGDASAGLRPDDFANELPVIALTCIDPRLNALFPNVLGLPGEQFIWLRNAGNIITGTMSSTMRSLALACAVKGGKEIAIIGHTDCQVAKTTTMALLDRLSALGVERSRLPDNINEFFGMFATEQQNVIKACDFVRQSLLIGPKIPVHGLLVDIETGKLEWVVNGYSTWSQTKPAESAFPKLTMLGSLPNFEIGEMKFPETKIGELATKLEATRIEKIQSEPIAQPMETVAEQIAKVAEKNWPKSAAPPKIPLPPRIRPQLKMRQERH